MDIYLLLLGSNSDTIRQLSHREIRICSALRYWLSISEIRLTEWQIDAFLFLYLYCFFGHQVLPKIKFSDDDKVDANVDSIHLSSIYQVILV